MKRTEHDLLMDRIDNWARWTWDGGSGQDSCASAERRYVPPKLTEAAAAARSVSRAPIDHADGERIDSAVGKLRIDLKRLMVAWYIDRRQLTGGNRRWPSLCRMFNMTIRAVETLHLAAVRDLGYQIRMMDHIDAVAKTRYKSPEDDRTAFDAHKAAIGSIAVPEAPPSAGFRVSANPSLAGGSGDIGRITSDA